MVVFQWAMSHATRACTVSVPTPGKGQIPASPLCPAAASVPVNQLIRIQMHWVSQRQRLVILTKVLLEQQQRCLSSVFPLRLRRQQPRKSLDGVRGKIVWIWNLMTRFIKNCLPLQKSQLEGVKLQWADVWTSFLGCTCSFTVLSLIQHIIPDLCRHVAIFPQPVAEREHHYRPHDEEQRPCFLLHGLPASAWGINRGDGRHHRDQEGQKDTENQIWGQQVVVQALQVENRHIYIINRWAGWYRRTLPPHQSSFPPTVTQSMVVSLCAAATSWTETFELMSVECHINKMGKPSCIFTRVWIMWMFIFPLIYF